MREVVIRAYVESLRMVWIVMCIFAGVIFVASLIWIDEISLTREIETEQGFMYDGRKSQDVEGQILRPSSEVLELGEEACDIEAQLDDELDAETRQELQVFWEEIGWA
jgi:hypothetical protein